MTVTAISRSMKRGKESTSKPVAVLSKLIRQAFPSAEQESISTQAVVLETAVGLVDK